MKLHCSSHLSRSGFVLRRMFADKELDIVKVNIVYPDPGDCRLNFSNDRPTVLTYQINR